MKPGQEAPDFELQDATGQKLSLRSLRGKPVLLNFWATWCAPCVEEMPSLENLAGRVGDSLHVVTVSVDEDWETVKKFFPRGHRAAGAARQLRRRCRRSTAPRSTRRPS